MDIDAIIARKPEVVIVDELAHTNAPGSRHTKRYQDVEEIVGTGINVITAINIQHVESLNALMRRVTGIDVRETVPDSFLAQRRSNRQYRRAGRSAARAAARGKDLSAGSGRERP